MEKEIKRIAPKTKSIFSNLFKGKSRHIVTGPLETTHQAGMEWDAEQGYRATVSLENLPETHRKFVETPIDEPDLSLI